MHEGACEGCWPLIHVTLRHPHKLSPSQQGGNKPTKSDEGAMRGFGTNPCQPRHHTLFPQVQQANMEIKGHQAIKNLFKYAHKGAHIEALKGCFHDFFFKVMDLSVV